MSMPSHAIPQASNIVAGAGSQLLPNSMRNDDVGKVYCVDRKCLEREY